jgi:hypothetical protein
MRDIMKLLLGDGQEGGEEIWDGRPGRRPRVADSREWCGTGTGTGDDAIGELAAALGRGRRGRVRVKRVVVKRPGPFGML